MKWRRINLIKVVLKLTELSIATNNWWSLINDRLNLIIFYQDRHKLVSPPMYSIYVVYADCIGCNWFHSLVCIQTDVLKYCYFPGQGLDSQDPDRWRLWNLPSWPKIKSAWTRGNFYVCRIQKIVIFSYYSVTDHFSFFS